MQQTKLTQDWVQCKASMITVTIFPELKGSISWDIMSCSLLNISRCFGGACNVHLATCFTLLSCSAYFRTLKMVATCSSETSVDFKLTTWRYIPDDRTLYNHLKSHVVLELVGELSKCQMLKKESVLYPCRCSLLLLLLLLLFLISLLLCRLE
jgi:hypothetical protein